jgi:ketopantoate reductase
MNELLNIFLMCEKQILKGSPSQPALSASLVVGSVTHGAYRKDHNHVVHSGMGSIKLARVDPKLPDLMDQRHQGMWENSGNVFVFSNNVASAREAMLQRHGLDASAAVQGNLVTKLLNLIMVMFMQPVQSLKTS